MNIMFNIPSFLIYIFIGIELFINAPMNGLYNLSLNLSKDNVLQYGFCSTFFFAIIMTYYNPLDTQKIILISIIYFLYYMLIFTHKKH